MSARRAPIALRMPISRVRSVTVTSMMFMMPMPPTSSEIAGDRAEQHGERLGRLGAGAEQLRLVEHPVACGRCVVTPCAVQHAVTSACRVTVAALVACTTTG